MTKPEAHLLDLLARRYPNRRPSDYLDIKDNWTAFQVDSALAQRGELEDNEKVNRAVDTIVEALANVGNQLARTLGAKSDIIKVKPRPRELEPNYDFMQKKDELPTLDQAIQALGGKGTIVERK